MARTPGSVISAIGIGLLVLGIIEGPERGWSNPLTLVGLIGGVVFLVGFIWVELRTDEPLLDAVLRLCRLLAISNSEAASSDGAAIEIGFLGY
jgi:uncharacterized membrane protein